jgi:hypothetical protein
LVGFIGVQLANLSEWLLGKAQNFTVTSYADLMVVLALALDQVGLIKRAEEVTGGFASLGNRGGTHRGAEGDPEEGEELSFPEFLGKIGFVVDEAED